jgi:4a-hydroxytetrahydrobiopterin dehydratase
MSKLDDEAVRVALEEGDLPGWSFGGGEIHKEYTFPGFRAAIAFIDRLAERAIEAKHHPDLENHYNRVKVSLSTHDEGGVTEADLTLARAIEAVSAPPDA